MKYVIVYVLLLIYLKVGYAQTGNLTPSTGAAYCLDELDGTSLQPFIAIQKQSKIMLFGENHEVAFNYQLYAELIKRLNMEAGVRTIILERGLSDAYILNEYLKTGNEALLKRMFFSREAVNFVRAIYAFNKSLSRSNKLNFVGVDAEGGAIIRMVNVMFDKMEQLPKGLVNLKQHLNSKQLIGKRYTEINEMVRQAVNQDTDWLKQHLSPHDYKWLILVINNKSDRLKGRKRNAEMALNLEHYQKTFGTEKGYFGYLGTNHTDMRNNSFAYLVNKQSGIFQGAVSVIQLCYIHSSYLNWFINEEESINVNYLKTLLPKKTVRSVQEYIDTLGGCQDKLVRTDAIPVKGIAALKKASPYILYLQDKTATTSLTKNN